jgi:hypothetical protein
MIRVIFAATVSIMALQECVGIRPEKLGAEEIAGYANLRVEAAEMKDSCDGFGLYSRLLGLSKDASEITTLTNTSANPTIVKNGQLIVKVINQLDSKYDNGSQPEAGLCVKAMSDIDRMIGQQMYIIAENRKLTDLSMEQMMFWKRMERQVGDN